MMQTFLKTSDVREEKNEPSFGRETVHLNLTILITFLLLGIREFKG